jgi:hypothetical protein
LWAKIIRPLLDLREQLRRAIPAVQALTNVFGGNATMLSVLNEIAAQFKTDSGSSLRDVVNGLAAAAEENGQTSDQLRIGAEAARTLAERDHQKLRAATGHSPLPGTGVLT